MDWVTRLNIGPAVIPLGSGRVDILHWVYNAHLPDNEPHRHTFFEVCLVGGYGDGVFTNLGHEYDLHPGDLFIARPGALHRIVNRVTPLMELYWLSYQWHAEGHARPEPATWHPESVATVDEIMRAFDKSMIVHVDAAQARPVSTLWQALASMTAGESVVDAQIVHLTAALVLAISQAVVPAQSPAKREPGSGSSSLRETSLRLALRYIEDNLDQELSIPQIAAYIAVSPRQLSRIFREFVDTSPADYVSRARLDRAAALLRSTDRPVKDIAAQVGIPDIHHFTRVFSRYAGTPPAAYRNGVDVSAVPKRQNPGRLV